MSTQYENSASVPDDVIINRLKELSDAIIKGKEVPFREFTMRIPAEYDRDADLVLCEAARRIQRLKDEVERSMELTACVEDVIATCVPHEGRFLIGVGQGVRLAKALSQLQEQRDGKS